MHAHSVRLGCQSSSRAIGSFDEPENEDKNDCPDHGNNNASEQAPASGDTKRTEKKSSEQSPQYSNNDVSNYAEAAAFHKHSC